MIMLKKFDELKILLQANSTNQRRQQQLVDEEEDSDVRVIKLMSNTKEQVRRKTTPADAFRVMKCPVTTLASLTEFEKELEDNIKLRKCLRYAISASVTDSSTTDKVNLACVREILKKVATNKVWTLVSVSGRSGTQKVSLEHKFPNIFNVVTQLIEEKTSIKLDSVKEFISRVLRARTSSDNASKKKKIAMKTVTHTPTAPCAPASASGGQSSSDSSDGLDSELSD